MDLAAVESFRMDVDDVDSDSDGLRDWYDSVEQLGVRRPVHLSSVTTPLTTSSPSYVSASLSSHEASLSRDHACTIDIFLQATPRSFQVAAAASAVAGVSLTVESECLAIEDELLTIENEFLSILPSASRDDGAMAASIGVATSLCHNVWDDPFEPPPWGWISEVPALHSSRLLPTVVQPQSLSMVPITQPSSLLPLGLSQPLLLSAGAPFGSCEQLLTPSSLTTSSRVNLCWADAVDIVEEPSPQKPVFVNSLAIDGGATAKQLDIDNADRGALVAYVTSPSPSLDCLLDDSRAVDLRVHHCVLPSSVTEVHRDGTIDLDSLTAPSIPMPLADVEVPHVSSEKFNIIPTPAQQHVQEMPTLVAPVVLGLIMKQAAAIDEEKENVKIERIAVESVFSFAQTVHEAASDGYILNQHVTPADDKLPGDICTGLRACEDLFSDGSVDNGIAAAVPTTYAAPSLEVENVEIVITDVKSDFSLAQIVHEATSDGYILNQHVTPADDSLPGDICTGLRAREGLLNDGCVDNETAASVPTMYAAPSQEVENVEIVITDVESDLSTVQKVQEATSDGCLLNQHVTPANHSLFGDICTGVRTCEGLFMLDYRVIADPRVCAAVSCADGSGVAAEATAATAPADDDAVHLHAGDPASPPGVSPAADSPAAGAPCAVLAGASGDFQSMEASAAANTPGASGGPPTCRRRRHRHRKRAQASFAAFGGAACAAPADMSRCEASPALEFLGVVDPPEIAYRPASSEYLWLPTCFHELLPDQRAHYTYFDRDTGLPVAPSEVGLGLRFSPCRPSLVCVLPPPGGAIGVRTQQAWAAEAVTLAPRLFAVPFPP
eukprot:TRINITY_DN7574_c0_g1_i3.p1 TRINITY_DN7574_c0_g1~~TRINITY_DN7574_c0_g1_i3.p1  ORF type:complete len:837 (-),score=174.72 TRINITY_DN7574_c0_g1_i3:302-2812(-)